MENNNTKSKIKDISVEKESLEEMLHKISSEITTVDEWENYINKYHKTFCTALAKLEARGNKCENNVEKPIAVITGGQPGAGKSALIKTYRDLLKDSYNIDAIVNNADFYRFCVPGSYRIAKDFPESASKITDPVVKFMRKNLIEESIAQGQSIIIENTLGDTIAVDLIDKSNKHDIWIALMAVPREESLLSDFERYIKMKENCEIARLVSIEAHDKRYYALDKIANQLENRNIRILVHSRGETDQDPVVLEYDSKDESNNKYRNTKDAMNSIRSNCFKKGVSGYTDRLKNIRIKMEKFGMTEEEKEELEKLEQIINLSISRSKDERGE